MMQTVLVINSKGGSGKTTIASNLASLFAASHLKTVLMDYDPQGSSLYWNSIRQQGNCPAIHLVDASHLKVGLTRTFQLRIPDDIERVVIDAPAGMCRKMLAEMVSKADVIVVPVLPSPIDIHASSEFIYELKLIINTCRYCDTALGIIANRARSDNGLYEPLKCFLEELDIPFITTLSDTDNYISAVEKGMGIHELKPQTVKLELSQWLPLVKWLADTRSVTTTLLSTGAVNHN
ncbi:MAG: AAA family ATPase [Thiotrichaceae bacterium]|nr:AAA family ATPase [Thiotrichaceae bacterium]PCI13475.1 MAG: hypothetical protein COB71_05800 [Thiotrichales bacterium]